MLGGETVWGVWIPDISTGAGFLQKPQMKNHDGQVPAHILITNYTEKACVDHG